jgi:hypothetical protein
LKSEEVLQIRKIITEETMANIVYIGSLITFIGAIWLVILSIQTGKTGGEKALWVIVNFICQPIGGIVFFFMKRVGLIPLLFVIVGFILTIIGFPSVIAEMMKNMPR